VLFNRSAKVKPFRLFAATIGGRVSFKKICVLTYPTNELEYVRMLLNCEDAIGSHGLLTVFHPAITVPSASRRRIHLGLQIV
jgi:hypothetical protein